MNVDWLEKNNIYRYVWKDGLEIFYSPIARRYVVATNEQFQNYLSRGDYKNIFTPLADYVPISQQSKVQTPADYTLLTVLPNNVCNFSCSYCYSATGRNGSYLSEMQLKAAIDFFINSKPNDFCRPLTISYMGGGEPMLSWPLVSKGILYAKEKAIAHGFRLKHRIITNGSILNEASLTFIKDNDIDVSVSFEILRDIQELQRKKFDVVDRNIRILIEKDVNIQINATITPANVNRMGEMLEHLLKNYSHIRNIMFEPVIGQHFFPSPDDMKRFYNVYTNLFIQCLYRAEKEGVSLTSFAYLRTIFPLERACPGELCITSDGQFTGCYCVSSPRETLFSQTRYGWIDKCDHVHFDMESYKKLKSHNVYERAECKSCVVKWNCGGGCYYQYASYDDLYRQEVCSFTRSFFRQLLKYKIETRLPVNVNYPILLKE